VRALEAKARSARPTEDIPMHGTRYFRAMIRSIKSVSSAAYIFRGGDGQCVAPVNKEIIYIPRPGL